MWSPLATYKKGIPMDDFKTNYSVARVVTHTRDNISKFEKHNARKNLSEMVQQDRLRLRGHSGQCRIRTAFRVCHDLPDRYGWDECRRRRHSDRCVKAA